MSYRYKLGLPEVISIIVGTTLMVLITHISHKINFAYEYELGTAVLSIAAIVFGTISALLIAITSCVLHFVLFGGFENLFVIMVMVIGSLFVGHYAPILDVRNGSLVGKKILDVFVIRLITDVVNWMFMLPFFSFLFYGRDLFEMIHNGVFSVIFTTAMNIVVIPILWMVNRFCLAQRSTSSGAEEY